MAIQFNIKNGSTVVNRPALKLATIGFKMTQGKSMILETEDFARAVLLASALKSTGVSYYCKVKPTGRYKQAGYAVILRNWAIMLLALSSILQYVLPVAVVAVHFFSILSVILIGRTFFSRHAKIYGFLAHCFRNNPAKRYHFSESGHGGSYLSVHFNDKTLVSVFKKGNVKENMYNVQSDYLSTTTVLSISEMIVADVIGLVKTLK